MKLSISLDNKEKFIATVDSKKGQDIFNSTVSHIIGIISESDFGELLARANLTETEMEQYADQTIKEIARENEYKESPIYKKMVTIKCPDCGEISTPVLKFQNDELIYKEHHLICRSCGKQLPQFEKLEHAEYNCPNCGNYSKFMVANDLKEATCINCKSPIDLLWHDKRKRYLSANLFDKRKG